MADGCFKTRGNGAGPTFGDGQTGGTVTSPEAWCVSHKTIPQIILSTRARSGHCVCPILTCLMGDCECDFGPPTVGRVGVHVVAGTFLQTGSSVDACRQRRVCLPAAVSPVAGV